MYQTITNAQNNVPIQLQESIDNRHGNLRVGLKSITYTVGWYNIQEGEYFYILTIGDVGSPRIISIPPGLYNVEQLIAALEVSDFIKVEINEFNGYVKIKLVSTDINILGYFFSDNVANILGVSELYEDKIAYDNLVNGIREITYYKYINSNEDATGTKVLDLSNIKTLNMYLNCINNTENIVDGARSNLLTRIGIPQHSFGKINTFQISCPEYKKLINGSITELNIEILDNNNKKVKNNNLPITILLHII